MSAQPPAAQLLSEPPTARFLRVVRRELALSLLPDLQSERSRGVADLMMLVLDHLIAREEQLPELGRAWIEAQHRAGLSTGTTATDAAIEDQVVELVKRLAHAPEADQARAALQQALGAERALHDALEQHERDVAAATTVSSEQPTFDAEALQTYLQNRFGTDVEVIDIKSPMGGYSKDTFIARLRGRHRPADGIVLRCDLPGGPLETTATSELAVLQAMHGAGVPVAEPLWAETDATALGRPFIAVGLVAGRQPMNMKLDFTGDDAAASVRQLARVLAQIHQVDPRDAGIDAEHVQQPASQHILRLLDQFEAQWRRRRLGPSPTIAAGLQWMRSNIPQHLPSACVVHGDATLRNMLFDNGRATAMLDWETWHLGDPGEDLAYCRDEVQRFLPWTEFLAEYHAAGGPQASLESAHYWGMWMYLRGAITSVSLMDRLLDEPPPDIRPAFGGPHFTRYCVRKIAEFLQHV